MDVAVPFTIVTVYAYCAISSIFTVFNRINVYCLKVLFKHIGVLFYIDILSGIFHVEIAILYMFSLGWKVLHHLTATM